MRAGKWFMSGSCALQHGRGQFGPGGRGARKLIGIARQLADLLLPEIQVLLC
jgi:hypothetical protein